MSLSSNQLDAFLSVARTLNFSEAAVRLHVTQSALSQRVMNLEEELGSALFVRNRAGLRLTNVGEELLRYCQMRESLEADFVDRLKAEKQGELGGVLRIAGYSSVVRSVLMPALAPLLRANPKIQCEFFNREMNELRGLLQRGEADFIVTDTAWDRDGVESLKLGEEEYVVIESRAFAERNEVYLDHDPNDTATVEFFRKQKAKPAKYRRTFLDDVYGILDGVALGYGRAVMSRHLITKNMPIRIVKGFEPRRVPVLLHFQRQPFYSRLHQAVREVLSRGCEKFLSDERKKS